MLFSRLPLRVWLFLTAVATLFLPAACDDTSDLDSEQLPGDARPSIRRVAPSQGSLTGSVADQLDFSFTLADDEALTRWTLLMWFDDNTTPDTLVNDTALMGTLLTRNLSYIIPDSMIMLGQCKNFTFKAYVWDNRMQMDSSQFIYQVCTLPTDTCSPAQTYQVLYYSTGDSVYSPGAGGNLFRFNLLQRNYATTDAASDIRVLAHATVPDSLSCILSSPNTNPQAVFVVLKPSQFNFATATWCTMHQAFITHTPTVTTPKLEVGDVIILNMALPPTPPSTRQHYAAIEVVAIVDGPGSTGDYIRFRYKRTSPS
jgi:hypothetical protein